MTIIVGFLGGTTVCSALEGEFESRTRQSLYSTGLPLRSGWAPYKNPTNDSDRVKYVEITIGHPELQLLRLGPIRTAPEGDD